MLNYLVNKFKQNSFQTWMLILLPLVGTLFAYRLVKIPSRIEIAIFFIGVFLFPSLKFPNFSIYYLFSIPCFIPMFRRMYYLVADRPTVDYLMLISDGIMVFFFIALVFLWVYNKEKVEDKMSVLIMSYSFWLFSKIFILNESTVLEGFYGFKFNGLYIPFYFAGSYLIRNSLELKKILRFVTYILIFTALYGIKQIVFGFSNFEQSWIDSIAFTTLKIEGVVRPFSTFVSPAAMSDAMSALILFGAFWLIIKQNFCWALGLLAIVSAIPPILIATVRTNWFASIAGLGFYFGYLRIKQKWLKIAGLLLIICFSIFYSSKTDTKIDSDNARLSGQSKHEKRSLSDIMIKNRTQALTNPLQEYSLQKRMEIWTDIWNGSFVQPLGKGMGTSGYAHSYYFQLLGEAGFPGIALYLTILIILFRRCFIILKNNLDKNDLEMTRFFLTILFTFSILNITGTHLCSNPADILFWFSGGAISYLFKKTLAEKTIANAMAITSKFPPLSELEARQL